MKNKYRGTCRKCGFNCIPGDGRAVKVDGEWKVEHNNCSKRATGVGAKCTGCGVECKDDRYLPFCGVVCKERQDYDDAKDRDYNRRDFKAEAAATARRWANESRSVEDRERADDLEREAAEASGGAPF